MCTIFLVFSVVERYRKNLFHWTDYEKLPLIPAQFNEVPGKMIQRCERSDMQSKNYYSLKKSVEDNTADYYGRG
jgi:hypothetical protein